MRANAKRNATMSRKYEKTLKRKKQAERDLQLLANRIQMLKHEEQKAFQKIEKNNQTIITIQSYFLITGFNFERFHRVTFVFPLEGPRGPQGPRRPTGFYKTSGKSCNPCEGAPRGAPEEETFNSKSMKSLENT